MCSSDILILDALSSLNDMKNMVNLEEIKGMDMTSITVISDIINGKYTNHEAVKLQAVLDYTYERINIGDWKSFDKYYRKTITICSFLKLLLTLQWQKLDIRKEIGNLYKIIDFGLMFGCPLESGPILHSAAKTINKLKQTNNTDIDKNIIPTNTSDEVFIQGIKLNELDCPSMEGFLKNCVLKDTPAILKNTIDYWPALDNWKDQNYLLEKAGLRTVPIEIGSKYTDSEWTQKLMTIEEFIKNHIYNQTGPTGYLAQYQLFDQIPELKNDIIIPEYCYFSDTDEPIDINAWFGPKGTVSPLHHDPKRNILAQVVGEKRLYLFSPSDSEYLYPHEHDLLSNTAKVDPRKPDLDLYPQYVNAKVYSCILKPGDVLYIPPKWWHFVESLTVSFSVSFWWL